MLEPAFPADEAERLEELRRLSILDTAPEERFDRITRTAQRLFGVPITLVSLVDARRQWFKSRQGLEAPETPRRISFCGHAILQDRPLVVPDAQADPRFADNPLVTGAPHVRAYAGHPLRSPSGARLGTLCLIDSRPRAFGPADLEALHDLAAWAELELNVDTVEHATQVARDREEKLQSILDNAADAIVTLSAEGMIETFNAAAERMYGRDESRGMSVMDWVAPESREAIMEAFVRRGGTADASRGVRQEFTCLRADGSTFPAEISVARVGRTRRPGYTLIVRDVSERKRVDRMKNEFISTVSHELRTPLTSVRGSIGLVLGGATGAVPDKARTLLDIAANNCDRLVRLINDMLDIEKIASGHMRFELAPQPLGTLARQATAATDAFAQSLGVRYQVHDAAPGLLVMADGDRLVQVLVNLLSNAAKFSPAGSTVDVAVDRADPSGKRARVTVSDRGPGIPADLRDRMFARFVQGDASDARRMPGTGLGLAISRAIVDRLGGSIGFEDRDGGGTVFFFELPALPQAAAAVAPRANVLVCEDDPDIARLVGMLLERGGLRSDVARSADEARQKLAAQPYGALTLDIGLPGEDGLSLLRWLRSRPDTAELPVVVLSAVDAPDGRGAAAFGALDWLVKPIDEDRLLNAVRLALRGTGGARPVVLHVEDDPDLRRVIGVLLEASCDTVPAASLAEAASLLAARAFDLVLLDMQLPDGDACGLLAALPPMNATTPVVIFSAAEVSADIAAKVRSALVKSRTSDEELLAVLRRVMGERAAPHNLQP